MDTGGLKLNLLKPEKELPKSPGLELIALLARGKRDLQQIKIVVNHQHPVSSTLDIQFYPI